MACGFIALAALHNDSFFQGLNSNVRPSVRSFGSDASGISGVTINRSPDFFEWTNGSSSAFNVGSFLPGKTN
jgi:hypothetical protein